MNNCLICGTPIKDKNVIGLNKKLFGLSVQNYFCMECLADYMETTKEDIIEKIEYFKENGCTLFE